MEAALEGAQAPESRNQRSWEGLLEGPESPCEADCKICCCVWDGAGQVQERGRALSFKSSQYQEAGSKVGTEDTEEPFPSMGWILGRGEAGSLRPSLLCLPRSALIWVPPCPHCVSRPFLTSLGTCLGQVLTMTSMSSWLLLSVPSPLKDVIFSRRLTCYHSSSLL